MFVKEVSFTNCFFYKPIYFHKIIFKENMYFNNTCFKGQFCFTEMTFIGVGNFYFKNIKVSSIFNLADIGTKNLKLGKIIFIDNDDKLLSLNAYFKQVKPSDENDWSIRTYSEFRRTCSLLKEYYQLEKNVIDSNIWYALEMKSFEKEITFSEDLGQKIMLKVIDYVNNYGQSIFRPIAWILGLSFVPLVGSLVLSFIYNTDYVPNLTMYDMVLGIMFPVKDILSLAMPFNNEIKGVDTFKGFLLSLTFILLKLFSGIAWYLLGRAINRNIKRIF